MANRTAQRPNQGNNNSQGSGSIVDNIITIAIILGLLIGGFFYVKANDVKSVNDFLLAGKGTVDKLKTCADTDEITACISEAFSNATGNKKSTENNNSSIGNEDSVDTLATLQTITLEEPEDKDYDRADYKHWTTRDSGCTTREEALKLQGQDVKTAPDDDCKVVSGKWFDWYGGELTITNPSELDLDHIVPLSYANSHGAADWGEDKKEEFANDLTTQLVLVSAKENRIKSDSGASEYMPPNESYHCRYASRWVKTVDKYDLSITEKDKEVLEDALQTC